LHTGTLKQWTHRHVFHHSNDAALRGTRWVLWITLTMMTVEIIAGWWFGSMALLADGWHMSSHALAIGLTVLAYGAARRYAADTRFAFGTWKIEILGGFASAILLLGVAVLMVIGSAERLISPQPIQYREAIVVGVLGLAVNILCALILGRAHHHDHGHAHKDEQLSHHHHHDLNLKSAYLHVLADAATSVLAIIALTGGWLYGWAWLDPVMGIVGAVLVALWARGLIMDTGKVLLDREMDHPVVDQIRQRIESENRHSETRVTDLHVWRVGKSAYSCALTLVTHDSRLNASTIRNQLTTVPQVVHATIEIAVCPDAEGHTASPC